MQINFLTEDSKRNLYPKKFIKSEPFFAAFTFVCQCMGASILSLGKIQSQMGFFMWGLYYAIAVCYVFFTFKTIATATYHGNFQNVSEIIKCLYGQAWGYITDISVIVGNAAALTSYIAVCSDYIRSGIALFGKVSDLADGDLPVQILWRRVFKVVMSYGIIFPLTFIKKIQILNRITSISIVLVLIVIIVVTIRFAQYAATDFTILPDKRNHPKPPIVIWPEAKQATLIVSYFPMFITYFSAHPSISVVQKSASGTPKERLKSISISAMLCTFICLIFYVYMGTIQSLMFDKTCSKEQERNGCIAINSNILLNFNDDTPLSIIKLCYSVLILLSYPCVLFPMREGVMGWFKLNNETKSGYGYFILISFILTTICMIVAIFIPNLDVILSLYANIGGIIIYEFLPIMIWYKMPLLKQNSIGDKLQKSIEVLKNEEPTQDELNEVIYFTYDTEGIARPQLSGLEYSGQMASHESFINQPQDIIPAVQEQQFDVLVQQEIDIASTNPKLSTKTKKQQLDKYRLGDLSKLAFKPQMCSTITFYGFGIFFCILNICAIVFTFI